MLVNRAYRHRLALTAGQEGLCGRIAGCCRLVYNSGLEQRKLGYTTTGRGIGYEAHTYYLREVKADPEFAFLREAPAHCLQQALRDLDDAYQRFFAGQSGYPRARRRGQNDAFRFPDPDPKQIGVHQRGRQGQVRLPKLGWVSVRNCYPRLEGHCDGPRLFEGELKSVTVKRDADGWYASFCCEVQVEPRPQDGEAVGIDRGVANSVALSCGELYHLPVISKREWRTIGALQSVVNRRQLRSRNREKAVRRLARYRQRLARRKHDALHQLTTSLAGRFSLIAVEELRVKNMTASARGTLDEPGVNVAQKAGLNRSILEQCWGEFERQLAYKLTSSGGELWGAPARDSSRACAACGHIAKENRESQAVFRCVACGHQQHADINAANIILARVQRGDGVLISSKPSGGTPGRASRRRKGNAPNACEDPTALKTPERPGPSRKNPARAGHPTARLPKAARPGNPGVQAGEVHRVVASHA